MNRFLSRGSIALLLAVAVVLPAARAVAQVRMPTHVACVGDSITAGYMASSSAAAYPSVLQNLFGASVQVRNFGHSGATLLSVGDLPYQNQTEYTAATTFVSGASATAVVDVIIMLGTNDSKSYNWMVGTGTRAQQYVTDLGAMVDHFASLPVHPLVYLALPPRAFTNTYGISGTIIHDQILPLIQQVATAKGLPVIDIDTPTATRQNLFPDGVHPNDTGYALIAQLMHDGLLRPLPGNDGGADARGDASGGGTGGNGTGGRGTGGTGAGGAGTGGTPADAGPSGTGGRGAGGAGTGGAGTGGTAVAGTGGTPVAGIGGALVDAGPSGTGGKSGTGGASTGADAGTNTPGTSGCSCRLSADRQTDRAGVGLLLAAIAFSMLGARRQRRRNR